MVHLPVDIFALFKVVFLIKAPSISVGKTKQIHACIIIYIVYLYFQYTNISYFHELLYYQAFEILKER